MKELTREQFKQEIEALVKQGRHFNVESDDAPVRLIMTRNISYGGIL